MSDSQGHSVAFVRTETIPQSAAPLTAAGPVKWMRDNLFATPANSLLTVAALYVVYLILSATLPWLLNGVWNAGSLAECREILQGTSGACFAVLTERWPQLIFGFKYPSTEYWRPVVAFLLMFVAMAPVLFFDLPRKLLIVTGLFPFVAFWLIWGGTIWVPIFALVGVI
ncbi:MAG: amino acid ABC transporter permease, partial [Sulfitobacter sp.]|nr:amino acid ABC transporter permease [Sulfitobacter sp.]